ncbi:glycosyltransferase [Corynebacterium sp. CCUG 70398]|nr:glycosyltransferase [Corynebacterium sp. CCUG 70398]MCQ4623240.1 glycosyltransferase [Corynebacterium sp. CCUG 70398]
MPTFAETFILVGCPGRGKAVGVNVLSIPAEHVYTQAIQPEGVRFPPDPDIDGKWWPHPALTASYWDQPREMDLVHIHFGFEHYSPDELRELVAALPVPLVLTVHDLDNPHLEDQAAHHESLAVLIDAAAQVVTLTSAAADVIAQRYSRDDVHVIPHPLITETRDPDPSAFGVAVFLKSLRGNVVAEPAFYRELAEQVPLTVYVHDVEATAELRRELAGLNLVVHEPMEDAVLHDAVASHAVCVLPYVRGTHSGWLEMCRDLGVSVAVPDCGCYASQADTADAVIEYAAGDGTAAGRAAAELLERGQIPYQGNRHAELEGIKQAYAAVYRAALAESAEVRP